MHQAALDACDAKDGVKDGVIEDPAHCRFDPGVMLCKGADAELPHGAASGGCSDDLRNATARPDESGAVRADGAGE